MNHPVKRLKILPVTVLLAALTSGAHAANPGIFLGVSHNFGGETGLTLKLLSTDQRDQFAAAIGVSYFPGNEANPWGLDTSLGYTFHRGALTFGYDWLHERMQVGLGVTNAKAQAVVAPAGSEPALEFTDLPR